MEEVHWADRIAKRVIDSKGEKNQYTCAAGITPSGTVHIGNFREVMTVATVSRALQDMGKKVRFIYSWDDYDRLRKIPKNIPNGKILEPYMGKPVRESPDPFDCHPSYAEHFEKAFEEKLKDVGIKPEFLCQYEKYKKCAYAEEIKMVMGNKDAIRQILDKYREEPLKQNWYPLSVYCHQCGTDNTSVAEYDGEYTVTYHCGCGYQGNTNFKKEGNVKLPWRVDWPMRWNYEKVDFEPGGKEHSTEGGSRTTASQIFTALYKKEPPVYQMYDFIILKGKGGKMSSSVGEVITLKDCLEIYEPEILRWLFVGTRPNAEFAISLDLDVFQIYEQYDTVERTYFGKENEKNKKKLEKLKREYELSQLTISPHLPPQPSFRHLTTLIQTCGDVDAVIKKGEFTHNMEKVRRRVVCAKNWIEKYAPEEMRFTLNRNLNMATVDITKKEVAVLKGVAHVLQKETSLSEEDLSKRMYDLCVQHDIPPKQFFEAAYKVLIDKTKGPRLANFLLMFKEEAIAIIKKLEQF